MRKMPGRAPTEAEALILDRLFRHDDMIGSTTESIDALEEEGWIYFNSWSGWKVTAHGHNALYYWKKARQAETPSDAQAKVLTYAENEPATRDEEECDLHAWSYCERIGWIDIGTISHRWLLTKSGRAALQRWRASR